MSSSLTIGLPRMHKEPGERRDFLPSFIAHLSRFGAQVVLEQDYGTRINFTESDYRNIVPGIQVAPAEEVYAQDLVIVLRYPDPMFLDRMRPGACLMTMVHYPTRPDRVADLQARGLEAISLDSIIDDSGRRLVENLRSVAWNGVEVAMKTLAKTYPAPGFDSPDRPPIRVALIGAGAVGIQTVQAAIRYGSDDLRAKMVAAGVPGVEVTVLDYDLTGKEALMVDVLRRTDLLIDATQRPDASKMVIANRWIGEMPDHAVLLDLSVDPYECEADPPGVKGLEGIPQGNLDQFVFAPDDPAWNAVPDCADTTHRRAAVSCYSWPGVHPRRCMSLYGKQLAPLMRTIMTMGISSIDANGSFFQRALSRAMLSRWAANANSSPAGNARSSRTA